jgi:hypothetical protein
MQQVMTDICVTIKLDLAISVIEYFRGNLPYFWRMFLRLNYIDMTEKHLQAYPKLNGYRDNGNLKF